MRFGPFANRTLPYWRGLRNVGSWVRSWYQLLTRGWHEQEAWNVDKSVEKFIVPLLLQLSMDTNCYPVDDKIKSLEDWKGFLEETVELLQKDPWEDSEAHTEGWRRLGEYGPSLWW